MPLTYWDMLNLPVRAARERVRRDGITAAMQYCTQVDATSPPSIMRNINERLAIMYEVLRSTGPLSFRTLENIDGFREVMCAAFPATSDLYVNILWALAQWSLAGQRVFSPTERLAVRLRHLRLQGVTGRDLKLPFRSIYVRVPADLGLELWDSVDQRYARCIGLFVTEDIDDGRVWHVMAVGEFRYMPELRFYDDTIVYWAVDLIDDASVSRILAQTADRMLTLANSTTVTREHLVSCVDVTRWMLNLTVYVMDAHVRRETAELYPDAERLRRRMHTATGKKRERIKGELNRIPHRPHIIIGHDVAPPQADANRGSGYRLEVRQLVRGHRKHQPFGPGRSERKEIFVAPYWRGPDDGDDGGSHYVLR